MIELKREVEEHGLIGKAPSELNRSLYQQIKAYAAQNNLWLFQVHVELGLVPKRVCGLDSIDQLDWFMKEFGYVGQDWSAIPNGHQQLLVKCVETLEMNLDILLCRYNIAKSNDVIYESLKDIKDNLREKNLLSGSVEDIIEHDAGNTHSLIIKFARRHGYTMLNVWTAMGISYNERLVVEKGRLKMDFVYHDDDDMVLDFKAKKLFGKTIREVEDYDARKTYERVVKYASRTDRSTKDLWAILKVKPSTPQPISRSFSTIKELKCVVKERGFAGKKLKDLRISDPRLCREIKSWQSSSSYSFEDLWEYVEIEAGPTLHGIVTKVRRTGCRTAGELREADRKLYKAACNVAKKNEMSIKEVWRMSGLGCTSTGHPGRCD